MSKINQNERTRRLIRIDPASTVVVVYGSVVGHGSTIPNVSTLAL